MSCPQGCASAPFLSLDLGTVASAGGDRAAAGHHYERSLQLSRSHGAPAFEAAALAGLAELASADRDHEIALSLVDKAAPSAATTGDVYLAASVLSRIAEVRAHAGQIDAADESFRRALSLAHRCAMRWHLAASLEGLAYVALVRHQAEEAARLIGAAGAVRASVGSTSPRTVLPSAQDRAPRAILVLGAVRFQACRDEGAVGTSEVVQRYVAGA